MFWQKTKSPPIPAMRIWLMAIQRTMGPSSRPCRHSTRARLLIYSRSIRCTEYNLSDHLFLSHIDTLCSLKHAYKGHPYSLSRRAWRCGPVTLRSGGSWRSGDGFHGSSLDGWIRSVLVASVCNMLQISPVQDGTSDLVCICCLTSSPN
jgi:hypothetical protein